MRNNEGNGTLELLIETALLVDVHAYEPLAEIDVAATVLLAVRNPSTRQELNLVKSLVEELPALLRQTELLDVVRDELVLRERTRRILEKEGLVPSASSIFLSYVNGETHHSSICFLSTNGIT